MPEQVKKILDKIVDWWKKFNNKQRILLISVFSVVMIALVILAVVMTKPNYEHLHVCKDFAEAAKIKEILATDESIDYIFSEKTLSFSVKEEDVGTASMLLGSSEIELSSYNINNVVNGSMTMTEADKQKLYKDYLEKKFADHISDLTMVENATVSLNLPKDDGTILSKKEKATAGITLRLKGDISEEQAYAMALYVSTQIGNETTEGITIIDQHSNVIYSGKDSQSAMSTVTTQLTYKEKMENEIKAEISDVLVKSHVFSSVQVAMNLDVDFDQKEVVKTELGIPNGMDGGAITQQSLYDMVSTNGYEGGVPGTDTNDDTTYVIEDGNGGRTEISESDTNYDYDKTITTTHGTGGNIIYENSSAMVMATKYVTYDEVLLRESGQLDDMTWEEFKVANGEKRVVEVDESYITAIANATGFPAKSITFMCYEEPQFIDEPDDGINIMDYAQIIVCVLIFALLGYVVFRSTRSEKVVEEIQPEISVESLLEATAEAHDALDDIGYSEKSDVRVMIEKFVDENPEAVASLLRNWLNEEWE